MVIILKSLGILVHNKKVSNSLFNFAKYAISLPRCHAMNIENKYGEQVVEELSELTDVK